MTISYDKLMALAIPDAETTYTARDTMFYALSLGLGADPLDSTQLAYTYEKSLRVLPTMAVVLAAPGLWMRELDTGIDYSKVVHGSQQIELVRPLPVAGTVVGRTSIIEVIDKGPTRGAIVISRRDIHEKVSGALLAKVTQSTFCRADGGFGGPVTASPPVHALPERDIDIVVNLETLPQLALLYRLNGDLNPLHADPATARQAGFARPILHGLATFGLAGWSVISALSPDEPERLQSLSCRFTAPVYPGQSLRAELWRDDEGASFRVRAVESDTIVVNNGRALLSPKSRE